MSDVPAQVSRQRGDLRVDVSGRDAGLLCGPFDVIAGNRPQRIESGDLPVKVLRQHDASEFGVQPAEYDQGLAPLLSKQFRVTCLLSEQFSRGIVWPVPEARRCGLNRRHPGRPVGAQNPRQGIFISGRQLEAQIRMILNAGHQPRSQEPGTEVR